MAKKHIVVTSIKWNAPKLAGLPKRVVIGINEAEPYEMVFLEEVHMQESAKE